MLKTLLKMLKISYIKLIYNVFARKRRQLTSGVMSVFLQILDDVVNSFFKIDVFLQHFCDVLIVDRHG